MQPDRNETVLLSGIRCLAQPRFARLGRLTKLVGEDSTGKSTLLAIR